MDAKRSTQIITADSQQDLDEKVQKEIMERGWETDGTVIENPDGTFSQKMIK